MSLKLLSLLVLGSLLITGCASSGYEKPRRISDENVSQLPWNRPQSWEGGGALGGMMGQ